MPRDSTQSPTPPPTLKEWVWSFDGADPQTMLRIAVAALEWATASVRDALVADPAGAAAWARGSAETGFAAIAETLRGLGRELASPSTRIPEEGAARLRRALAAAQKNEEEAEESSSADDPGDLLGRTALLARAVAYACEIAAWSREAALAEPDLDAAEAAARAESGPIMALWNAVWHARRVVAEQSDDAMLLRLQSCLPESAMGGGRSGTPSE